MKIAIVAPEVLPVPPVRGGAVEICIEEVSACLTGHDVHVFSTGDPSLPHSARDGHRTYHWYSHGWADRLLLSSWKLPFKRPGSVWYHWTYARWVAAQVARLQPDVVWVHSRMPFVRWLRRAAPGAHLVLSLHNESNLDGSVWNARSLRSVDVVTGCSRFLTETAVERYPACAEKAHVLYNGVDADRFRPKWLRAKERERLRFAYGLSDKPVVLFVGRLVEEKGLHLLITAFRKIVADGCDAELLIVGKPVPDERSRQYVQRITRMIQGFESRIRLIGQAAPDEMRKFYLMSDVLAFPSSWKEPFGLVVVEAMSTGLPVIAFDQGGPAEILESERTGLLVPAQDGEAGLARALERCIRNPGFSERIGRAARAAVEARFTWRAVAKRLLVLCNQRALSETLGPRIARRGRIKKPGARRVPPPTILIAESGSGFGGSAKYLNALVSALNRRRYDLRVAAAEEGPFICQVRAQGVPLFLTPEWRFPWGKPRLRGAAGRAEYALRAGLQLAVLVPRIALWLKRQRVRIVHLNNEIFSHLPLLLAAKLARCRVVCHLHGWRPLTRLERASSRWVDVLVCVTEAGARFHSDQLRGRRVLAVPNGLPLRDHVDALGQKRGWQRARLGLSDDDIAVAILGRLVPWKGQEVYVRALTKAIRRHPNITGLIVGHDPSPGQPYLRRLEALVARNRLSDRIRFIPWQEDVWSIYAAADLVVHASTEPEPFGFVILEAMAAQRPVIATNSGGVGDVVVDGKTGLLVKPGDPDALADALQRLLGNRDFAEQLGQEGHERALSTFTIERNAAQMSAVYDQLLSDS